MIADCLPDSVSRIRMAAVLSKDLIREHDSRLSLLEFIKDMTGSLEVNIETLRYLIKHKSELAHDYVGTPKYRMAILLGDIEICTLRDLSLYPTAEEFDGEFLFRNKTWSHLGQFATPDFFEEFKRSPLYEHVQRCSELSFCSGLVQNPTLLQHVWPQPWFQECKWAHKREFFDIMGAPQSEWLRYVTRYTMMDQMKKARDTYAKMVAAKE